MSQQFLVQVNKQPKIVSPSTNIVNSREGKKFWFYDNGKALQAVQPQGTNTWKVN